MTIKPKNVVILALFALLLLLPAFYFDAEGADLHCQSLWVKNFSKQLWEGELYPRWIINMYAGNGSPVFFYYPPLAYYISALFYKILPHDYFEFLPMAASALVATFLSGFLFFKWIRKETTEAGALLGALMYMALPWHIGFNFYNSLLYSTVWAYAWLPLLMMSARSLAEGKTSGIYAFAISLCLMVTTNFPSTIICGPLAVLYIGFYFYNVVIPAKAGILVKTPACAGVTNFNKTIKQVVLITAVAIALGFGLSALFLLPSIAYLDYTMVSLHWYNIKMYWFRFSLSDIAQQTCDFFWLFQAAVIISYYVMTRNAPGRLVPFLLVASSAAFFMTSALSEWIWNHNFILKTLQEPARLFMVTTLTISAFAAIAAEKYKNATLIYIFVSVLMVFQIAVNAQTTVKSFALNDPQAYERYKLQIDQYPMYLGYPDLIKRYYSKDKDSLLKVKQDVEQIHALEGNAQLQITKWKPRDIEFSYTATIASTVRIHQSYYPGWQAFMNGEALTTSWDQDSGQMNIKLPPGSGNVELKLIPLWAESVGKLVSMLSLGIILIIFLIDKRSARVLT